jgi:hypothetical protein
MRAVLMLPLLILLAACAGPKQWEKPDTDREAAKKDLGDCRRGARNYAWRAQTDPAIGYGGRMLTPSTAYHYVGRPDLRYPYRDDYRFYHENRLASLCMRDKGYELNPVPTKIAPPNPPASPPRST